MAIKLKLSSNFSFTKLADSLDSIIKKQSAKSSEGFAKSAKKKITDGLRPALKKSTREIRRKRGTGGSKPLYETGSLFRSIKATDKGIEMNKYGIYFLRYSVGIIFVWFGILKTIGISPAQDLVANTVYWFDNKIDFVKFLGCWELIIGITMCCKPLIRVSIFSCFPSFQ